MPEITVSAVVKSKEDMTADNEAFDSKVSLDIASFGSQYPVAVYVKDEAVFNSLKKGSTYNVRLEQGKLGEGKDGSKQWHYRWRFLGLGNGAGRAAAPPSPAGAPQGQPTKPQPAPAAPDRGRSIERQVAVKAVTELVASGKVDITQYSLWFDFLCALIAGTEPDGDSPAQTARGNEDDLWPEDGKTT